jgi:hypothetical protein
MRGSCLCRGVQWEVEGKLEWMGHCHCSMCRKSHGGAFATFAGGFGGVTLRWLAGEELVARYASSPGGSRCFCSTCGAVVPAQFGEGGAFLPPGCLDDDPGLRPTAHIFVASKAPWYEIPPDGLERFDAYPPGIDAPALAERPAPAPPSRPGVLRGSCLCGGVAFETGRARGLVFCHCSRCRKGRSTAFAANVFAEPPFRYTRGAELARSYKVPEAKRFTVVFCSVCGGEVARDPGDAAFVGVPGGSLDDDPGPLPAIHIFAGSKAPWYEIAPDGLERFDAYPPGCRSSHDWVARNGVP